MRFDGIVEVNETSKLDMAIGAVFKACWVVLHIH